MTIRKLNRPFTFNNDLDQFFNDFFQAPEATIKDRKKRFWGEVPAVNISETDKDYNISVAAPGMSKEDFKIEIDEGIMSISSSVKEESTSEEENFTRREYNYSSFERRFTLPENVKDEEVNATYIDGILKIVIPKLNPEEKNDKKKTIKVS